MKQGENKYRFPEKEICLKPTRLWTVPSKYIFSGPTEQQICHMEKHPLNLMNFLKVSLNPSTVGNPQKKTRVLGRKHTDSSRRTPVLRQSCLPCPLPLRWLCGQLCPWGAQRQRRGLFLEILTFKRAFSSQIVTEAATLAQPNTNG